MKDKAAKYLALLITDIFMYIFNTVFVYIGFNFLLAIFVGMWEHLNEAERKVKKIKER
mgnify:CR=1 FL=1